MFKDLLNGFLVQKKSVPSLAEALRKTILERSKLKEIAYYNRNEAIQKYRTQIFQEKIMNIFENVHAGSNGTFKLD